MGRRTRGIVALAVVATCAYVGLFVACGSTKEERAIAALKRAGVSVYAVSDGRIEDTSLVRSHRVFASLGRDGHVIVTQEAPDGFAEAKAIANRYAPPDDWVVWNHEGDGTVIVALDPMWKSAAVERAITSLK